MNEKGNAALIAVAVIAVIVAAAAILILTVAEVRAPVVNFLASFLNIWETKGTLIVRVADPGRYSADVKHVYVEFSSLDVRTENTSWISITLSSAKTLDLVALDINASIPELGQAFVKTGTYTEIRLKVASAKAIIGNETVYNETVLEIPSGLTSGLKIDISPAAVVEKDKATTLLITIWADDIQVHAKKLVPVIRAGAETLR